MRIEFQLAGELSFIHATQLAAEKFDKNCQISQLAQLVEMQLVQLAAYLTPGGDVNERI